MITDTTIPQRAAINCSPLIGHITSSVLNKMHAIEVMILDM